MILLIPVATAGENQSIFDILNETYISNISELPESANPIIEKNIQWSGSYLAGWVDIVGFREMTCENGLYYVPGNPSDYAIVFADAGVYQGNDKPLMSLSEASGTERKFDTLDKTITIEQQNNQTIARLHAVLKWRYICRDSFGSFVCGRGKEERDFTDTELSPQTYRNLSDSFKVNLIQFNTSAFETIGIQTSIPNGLSNVRFEYGDLNATHKLKVAHVEQTAKGVYFANISYVDIWDTKGHIGRMGDTVVLDGNLSKMNLSGIKITGSNLYETITADQSKFNISREEFTPEKDVINPVLFFFVGAMLTFAFALNYLIKNIVGGV